MLLVIVICPAISALPFLLQVEIINISDKIFLMENSDYANVAACSNNYLVVFRMLGSVGNSLASCLHMK